MRTDVLEYISEIDIEKFIDLNNIKDSDSLLVQIFTSINKKEFIKNIQIKLLSLLPNVKIIGMTTSGEISNNGLLDNNTVLAFTSFEKTKIETKIVKYKDNSFQMGIDLINSFNYTNKNLKLLISFTDGLKTNGEEYLDGIHSISKDTIISGGMAGDYSKFEDTFVFNENEIIRDGAVAVGLYNKDLNIYTDYSFNWETIGKEHTVTKSIKNRVYEIDNMTAVEFYSYYLGEDIGNLLPAIGIEFPLVMKRDNVTIARAVLSKFEDGSLSFAGNITEGSKIRFGHGDVEMIINKGINNFKSISNIPIESIFIYSCMARKALLEKNINLELKPFQKIAPMAGCFTYGEFFQDKLLNQTMTILAISENNYIKDKELRRFKENSKIINKDPKLLRTQALSILVERTTKELEDLNSELEERVKKEVEKNKEKDKELQLRETQAQLGEMIEMIIHQWRQPLSAITSSASSAQVYQEAGILTEDTISEVLKQVLISSEHLNRTIEDFRDLFKADESYTKLQGNIVIDKTLTVIGPVILKNSIKLIKEYSSKIIIEVPLGLIMQVILNIIKNSIDVLLEKEISDPTIKIISYQKDDYNLIEIWDNAGGIPEDVIKYIFDKRFTTKGSEKGTGIGLNMSKTIMETKVNGKLTAHNYKNWAVLTMHIPKKN
ncbi:MAG: FIST N-terminal domain-containing protein [Campylobacterota bacterium]|nr:FIST N-terminal domain-containing protein [Campylobacterota bacterium]